MATLMDLNDRLFREMYRLEYAEGEELEAEIERARAIGDMAGKVIANASTIVKAAQVQQQAMNDTAARVVVPRLLMDESAPTIAERDEAL